MKNVGAKKNITKKTPILIIGLGSIGRRHYANLQSLGYREITVYDIDASKGATHDVRSITSLDDSTLRQHPVVFVCNPSHQHVATALRAIKAGCNVFVEKPLSSNARAQA
jgi:predicted dehydrogenase